jgi:dihydrodipicolinate synthase/N-acetylneuraminate lyase
MSTVFRDDLELKPAAIESNVRWMMEHGFGSGDAGFFIAPCADGEYVTLTTAEVGQVVAAVRRGSRGVRPIVAGIHAFDIRRAIELGQAARDAGAVAVMLAPPIYYTLNSEAIIDWYERFAAKVDIGIMLYEQSYRGPAVNAGMRPDLVGQLIAIPSVVAMKHIGLFALADEYAILDRYHDRIAYIDTSGAYATTTAHMHGAAGWVTEIAQFWPEMESRYWQLLEAGDYREAERWHGRLGPLFQFVFDHPAATSAFSWVTVLKAVLDYVGLEGGPVRPPFRALNAGEQRQVFQVLDAIGVPRHRAAA